MTDYKILYSNGPFEGLQDEVNTYLNKGYVLVGGVSSDGTYTLQAVAKPDVPTVRTGLMKLVEQNNLPEEVITDCVSTQAVGYN